MQLLKVIPAFKFLAFILISLKHKKTLETINFLFVYNRIVLPEWEYRDMGIYYFH